MPNKLPPGLEFKSSDFPMCSCTIVICTHIHPDTLAKQANALLTQRLAAYVESLPELSGFAVENVWTWGGGADTKDTHVARLWNPERIGGEGGK
jgi:hypothetical protein